MHRRQFLRVGGPCAVGSAAGCLAAPIADDRIYTCSYDADVFALADDGDASRAVWNESRSDQTTDIQLDRNDDILVCNRGDGLEKW